MDDNEFVARRFEEHRGHLRSVAYRMLGSPSEADDALRESRIRLGRSDAGEVENLAGWLATVVARESPDLLRSRTTRGEDPPAGPASEAVAGVGDGGDPAFEALLADSVGLALSVVPDTLAPAERLAFVLHDLFAVPCDEIAPIVGRSMVATRRPASRARRRVRATRTSPDAGPARQREVVDAFPAASRGGDVEALGALLDPDVVLSADRAAVETGAPGLVRGAAAVARTFFGRARVARPALVDGAVGLVWAPDGRPRVVFDFTVTDGKVTAISMVADPGHVAELDPVLLDA